ncbi:hypothetical protein Psal006b_00278 [Piscirickettsia salmonis]|uniref:Enoyl-CoA hydratase n=1 Tax=Piscirickettsia salmonis TaxID=1238 RepID=A0A1L6TF71_PISSA|nr:DUF3757 domain-containing protein [Piscirickettsia salmonis]AKP72463.2 hypothetical protein PSLF89_289 [Piscirickettsia salmonis LF-89 = ATCC VR-1361]ALB24076.1 enoyl-CoA hydratase [Piscirickettsia salmonis]ALY03887.1 hypothetical protein AWE47_14280 [Piscirickettsia salmonis]AMA43450.1 hypothetical protein AWJ11_14505 [Piscirickettsia salmonis]AOS35919.1 hypothetical protein AVM72_11620 [Piscirickettsia salmonis]
MKKVFILGSMLLLSSSLSFASDLYCPSQVACTYNQGQYQCAWKQGFMSNGGVAPLEDEEYGPSFTATFEAAYAGYTESGEMPSCDYEIKGVETHVVNLMPRETTAVIDNSTSDNAWKATGVVGNVTRYMCNTTNPKLCPIKTTESPKFNPSLSF